jgi:VanZ family protein
MGLIFYLSAQSELPHLTPPGWPNVQDVAGHSAVYAVLAFLWERALLGAGVRRSALWAFVITVFYGLSDEFHQSFVPGRTATIFDLATDAGAAALMLGVVAWARRRGEIRIKPRSAGKYILNRGKKCFRPKSSSSARAAPASD